MTDKFALNLMLNLRVVVWSVVVWMQVQAATHRTSIAEAHLEHGATASDNTTHAFGKLKDPNAFNGQLRIPCITYQVNLLEFIFIILHYIISQLWLRITMLLLESESSINCSGSFE